ncbi:hypothetical protein RvY_07331-2 [Ramazzottius varieornatus]|uniref:Cadherin domain-containing protein n=1 Tax=Ramazzottius varieornatus TaxID=947166 RepID=A0A1D1V1R4_RAMVA|nr:hypothetical protein RvY_07331-2 [Ramazzottius varieornatus]
MAVNPRSGQLNLADWQSGTFMFNYRATNYYGAATVPVYITCNNDGFDTDVSSAVFNNGISVVCYNNFCYNISSGSTAGGNNYAFSITQCIPNTRIGTVATTGAVGYAINSKRNGYCNGAECTGLFTVNYLTGVVKLTDYLSTGTYRLHVNIITNTGRLIRRGVTVTATCDSDSDDYSIDYDTAFYNAVQSFTSNTSTTASQAGVNAYNYICFGGNCYGNTGNSSLVPVSILTSTGRKKRGARLNNTKKARREKRHFSVIDYDANSVDTIASYKYITRNCTAGTIVGAVSAAGAASYFITNGDPAFTISSTGLISLSTAINAGRYLLSVQATSLFGQTSSVLVKVTVNCNLLSSSSSATSVTINGTCLYDNCNFNYAAPVFSQSPYTFTPTTCGVNASIGSVSATGITNNTNNTAYWIESGPWVNYFYINPVTGNIMQTAVLPLRTFVTLTVTAYNSNGVPTNAIVIINTTNCVYPSTVSSVTTTTTTTTQGPTTIVYSPYFPQTSYSLSLQGCATGPVLLGSVVASNAANYFISNGGGLFSINTAGALSTVGAVNTGTYNLIVTAVSSQGLAVSVPVTVAVVCTGTGVVTTTVASTGFGPFTLVNCAGGQSAGTISVPGAISYVINGGSTTFSISPTGTISITPGVTGTSGTYTLPITSFSSTGTPTTTSATVILICAGGG